MTTCFSSPFLSSMTSPQKLQGDKKAEGHVVSWLPHILSSPAKNQSSCMPQEESYHGPEKNLL